MCLAAPGLGSHEGESEMRASQGKTVWPVCPSTTVACCQMDRAVEHKRDERNKTQLVGLWEIKIHEAQTQMRVV